MSFSSLKEIIELAEQGKTTISELMIKSEVEQKGYSREIIIEKMSEQFTVMEEAVRKGTTSPVTSRTGLTGGDGHRLYQYAEKGNSFVNSKTLHAAANALSVSEVNAAMGRIVATPTAGSAGILPAVLVHAMIAENLLVKRLYSPCSLPLPSD